MKNNKTVIISCAGMGKRLGIGTTKALVNVGGKSLILRTLEQLDEVEDVRVVVGYQAEKVIEAVKAYRKDVTFVFNHDYMNNGTAASVSLALPGAKEFILTIDGDIIIHPDDMKVLLDLDYECICGCKIGTDDPVKYSVNSNGEVVSFSREYGDFEWTGVCHMKTSNLQPAERHVYQMLEPLLPKKSLFIRVKEIDTPDDYIRAEKWLENNYEDDVQEEMGK
ncbi:MAG: NTP transferase domain-containing protein [Clostridia bacterium]|nr:NTP transferase domain-containing protein [Clostridia bacterium]